MSSGHNWADTMARKLRVQFPGAIYHVMNRSDRREAIFASTELETLGWTELDLAGRRKGAPEKVRMAERLRRETTMPFELIAMRLHMDAGTYVAHLLQQQQRRKEPDGNSPGCTKTLF